MVLCIGAWIKAVDTSRMFSEEARQQFEERGYVVARGLFSSDETKAFIDHYMAMRDRGGDGWAEGGVDPSSEEPLKRYPRLMQPHRGDAISLRYMIDPRINEWLTGLLGLEPYAVQTMVYYKPAGARGQALHQDQRYLNVNPGTCIAAWLALDDCDVENGCLDVVPGSQSLPMLCPIKANTADSFTGETVPIPPGMMPESVPMKSGDVVFFNGSLIHGSPPNRSADRFRRILVGHYIVGEAKEVSRHYFPVYGMDGTIVECIQPTQGGGSCGTYVTQDGETVLEINSTIEEALAAH